MSEQWDQFDDDDELDGYCLRRGCVHGDGMMDCPECDNEWDIEEFPADFDLTLLEANNE
jgi:hypothetical protein